MWFKELNSISKSSLDVMTPKEFNSLFKEMQTKYNDTWLSAFNSLMIKSYEENFIDVYITEAQEKLVNEKIPAIIRAKLMNEKIHQDDSEQEVKRWQTGKEAEFAGENYTGYTFVDLSVYDNSIEAAKPDVHDRFGVKSSCVGNAPTIYRRRAYYPEIIFIKCGHRRFRLTGLYTPEMLNKYRTDILIKDKNMLKRKTAFYHYGVGCQFNSGKEAINALLISLGY